MDIVIYEKGHKVTNMTYDVFRSFNSREFWITSMWSQLLVITHVKKQSAQTKLQYSFYVLIKKPCYKYIFNWVFSVIGPWCAKVHDLARNVYWLMWNDWKELLEFLPKECHSVRAEVSLVYYPEC